MHYSIKIGLLTHYDTYTRKHLILLQYRVRLCMTIKYKHVGWVKPNKNYQTNCSFFSNRVLKCTYCLIIKNDNYINGFIREPIRQVVINPKNNIDKKFINIIIQSFSILFFENILIKNIIMCSTILIGIRRIVIRTNVPSNISKNTLFSYKGIIAINKNDTTNKISIIIADIKKHLSTLLNIYAL